MDELDRKLKNAHEQVFDLKERLAHVQAESKMKATQYEGKLNRFLGDFRERMGYMVGINVTAYFTYLKTITG